MGTAADKLSKVGLSILMEKRILRMTEVIHNMNGLKKSDKAGDTTGSCSHKLPPLHLLLGMCHIKYLLYLLYFIALFYNM